MGENLLWGGVTMTLCLVIQCFIVGVLFDALLILERKQVIKTTLFGITVLLSAIMLMLLAGNLLQMSLWAALFVQLGEFENFAEAFYHSVVNFTTLGYGDVVMSMERRLLGALEAANGVLMFGLATGLLFAVLVDLMEREWARRLPPPAAPDGSHRRESAK
jgi:hypothetical protein